MFYSGSEHEEYESQNFCRNCWNEEFRECNSCGEEFPRDNLQFYNDDPYCESCYNESFFYCNICENDRTLEDYEVFNLIGGQKICGDCVDNSPHLFQHCPHTGELIYLRNHSTYILENGRVISKDWARSNLPPSLYRSLESETERNRSAILRQIDIGALPNSLRRPAARRKPNCSELCSNLINKVKNELCNAITPGISPVHNRIYIGMELESFGGKFFTYNNSRAMKGTSIIMGPHRLLNRMLPRGTKMVRDGSIQGNNGQEFLPPVVKRQNDWKKIERTVKALKEMDWQANDTCGYHMHFSHALINPENPKLIKEIFRIFYYLEPFIFQCLPVSRRNNEYCRPISQYFTAKDIKQELKLDYWYYGNFWKKRIRRNNDHNSHPSYVRTNESGQITDHINFGDGKMGKENMKIAKEQDHYYVGRYIGCNLHALYTKGTLELRYFPSILEFSYVYAWAKIMERVFDYALKGGDYKAVEKIMKEDTDINTKAKALGKVFAWKDAFVKFLIGEIKTYQKTREEMGGMDMLTGQYNNEKAQEQLNKRLQFIEPSIIKAEPIPDLHPNAENHGKTKRELRIEAARNRPRDTMEQIRRSMQEGHTSPYEVILNDPLIHQDQTIASNYSPVQPPMFTATITDEAIETALSSDWAAMPPEEIVTEDSGENFDA